MEYLKKKIQEDSFKDEKLLYYLSRQLWELRYPDAAAEVFQAMINRYEKPVHMFNFGHLFEVSTLIGFLDVIDVLN